MNSRPLILVKFLQAITKRVWTLLCGLAVVAPALGQSLPQQFSAQFTNGASVVTVNFERYSIRSTNFNVVVQTNGGALLPYTAQESGTYLGTAVGISGAMACGTRNANGDLLARIFFEDGVMWTFIGKTNGGAVSLRGDTNWVHQTPTFTITSGAGTNQYAAEVGFDVSWAHFARTGTNVDQSVMIIEHSVMCADMIYLREAGILHRIGRVVIRAEQANDPYDGVNGGSALLPIMRDQWNTVLPPSTQDVAAMLTTSFVGGGLAYVGAVGTSNAYSVNDSDANGDFSVIWRHEVGHNWGSNHFEGNTPEGATIMSGNGLSRFSSPELSKIVTYRNTKLSAWDNLGPFAFQLPPRASMEIANGTTGSSTTIDVLANDSDGNGDAISILSFDAASNLGGTVTRSVGTGPGGRDQLVAQVLADAGQSDWFQYRIVDANGRTATGNVYLQGERPASKLSGTIIGTTGSYQNNAATTKAAAMDGNLATYYDAANATGDWVGLDLGAGSSLVVSKVRFCPRAGQAGRMNGGMFQASDVADFSSGVVTLFTISGSPVTGTLTSQSLDNNTAYRYIRYLGPTNGSCNIAEVEFWGGAPSVPNPPNQLTARGVHGGLISLAWNSTFLTTSYSVKRAESTGGPYTVIAAGVTSTNYDDAGLTFNKVYYYVISSVNEIGESVNSKEISAAAAAQPSGEWKFNEGSGTIAMDSSPSKNDGTVRGAVWTTGFLGGGLQFGGTNSVTFGTGPSVSGTNDFTLSAWIKTTAAARGIIMEQRDAGGFNGEFQLSMNANGTIQFTVYGDSAYQFDFAATNKVNDGAWHHVAAVRSGLSGMIYIDGNPTPAATATGSAIRNLSQTISFAVGRDVRDNSAPFNGIIDEVRIYKSTALTGTEIQALHDQYSGLTLTIVIPPAINQNGHFTVTFGGFPGTKFAIEFATVVSGPWTEFSSPTSPATVSSTGVLEFTDPDPTSQSSRFYRARSSNP